MGTQRELPLPENLDEPARLTARNAYNAIMIDRKGQKSEAHKKEFRKFIRKNHPASAGTVEKIADWLKEPRIDLLREIYENMGYIFFWECYLSALMIEWDGGLLCKNIGNGRRYRRRTPGGTFLYLAAYGMIVEDEEKNEWRKSFFAEHKAEFIQDSNFLLVVLI